MADPDKFQARVEIVTRSVREDYEKAITTVETLKKKMNELEHRISQKRPEETNGDRASLKSAIDNLERFTDHEILKSKEAWEKYEELKRECVDSSLWRDQLEGLQSMCKRTEQLATDLLCYSLGLVKKKSPKKD